VDVRADQIRSTGQQEAKNSLEHGRFNQFFQVCGPVLEALNNTGDAKAALFDNLGVIARKDIEQGTHHIPHHRE
jgi:hypothetical protein